MGWYDNYKEEKIVICRKGTSNKFWAAWFDISNTVHVRWGRIGSRGQSQTKRFPNSLKAGSFISDKFYEKTRKGYTDQHNGETITKEILDELSIEAAIVGTQNKCDGMQWVEITVGPNDTIKYSIATADRLSSPDCEPGLLVRLNTKKEYDGRSQFKILFTADTTWLETSTRCCVLKIAAGHSLHELVKKVEEAVGRNLS